MFLLSCGRESQSVKPSSRSADPAFEQAFPSVWTYETFVDHHDDDPVELRKPRKKQVAHSSSVQTKRHSSLGSNELPSPGTLVDRIDSAMSQYDQSGPQLQAAKRHSMPSAMISPPADGASKDVSVTARASVPGRNRSMSHRPSFSGLFGRRQQESINSPRPRAMVATRRYASDHVDTEALDELVIPEHHVGLYEFFCRPHNWSPAFAAPGDFTVRLEKVVYHRREIVYHLGVICSCVLRVARDEPTRAIKRVSKRKSFVKHVKRTHREMLAFMDAMALAYLGHGVAEKVPLKCQQLYLVGPSNRELKDLGDTVLQLLTDVLQTTTRGFNRLAPVHEPVSRHPVVRDFLDLAAVAVSDVLLLANGNTCDARLDYPEERPFLPSPWLDLEISVTIEGIHGNTSSMEHNVMTKSSAVTPKGPSFFTQSPRVILDDLISHSFNRFDTSSLDVIPYHLTRSISCDKLGRSCSPWSSGSHGNKCIRFLPPTKWQRDHAMTDGAFTVEISEVIVRENHAHYVISVLCYAQGRLEVTQIERRFSQLCELVQTIDQKLPLLCVSKLLPSRTMFRSVAAVYLEQRARELQRFLELFLQLKFLGALEEEIPMIAEPNVRQFLALPAVEWTLVPWKKDLSGTRTAAGTATLEWKLARQAVASMSSLSPTAQLDFSPRFSLVSPRRMSEAVRVDQTVQYESLGRRRSGSM